jgi:hypothetical protein
VLALKSITGGIDEANDVISNLGIMGDGGRVEVAESGT